MNNNKTEKLSFRVTKNEKKTIEKYAKKLGYEKSLSTYFRNRILRKDILLVNPNYLIDELYSLKSELNKIGSNINQIANYYNFLLNNRHNDDKGLEDLKKIVIKFEIKMHELNETINKTLDKI